MLLMSPRPSLSHSDDWLWSGASDSRVASSVAIIVKWSATFPAGREKVLTARGKVVNRV